MKTKMDKIFNDIRGLDEGQDAYRTAVVNLEVSRDDENTEQVDALIGLIHADIQEQLGQVYLRIILDTDEQKQNESGARERYREEEIERRKVQTRTERKRELYRNNLR